MQCETKIHSDIKYFPQTEAVSSPLQGQGKQVKITTHPSIFALLCNKDQEPIYKTWQNSSPEKNL